MGQDCNNGSVRQFRLGYNDSFDFTIGDWGGTNANNTWTQQIGMSYASPFDAVVITSIGSVRKQYGYSISDQRIKTNIKTISSALQKVQQLK